MNGAEMLIPILVPLGAFALVFGIVYLKTRENLSMIDKGMNPKTAKSSPRPYQSLKFGLFMLGAGLGLFLAYLMDIYMLADNGNDNVPIYFGLIGIFAGLGLIASYRIEKKEVLDKAPTEEEV
jgi:hypothetical protein